MIKDVKSYFHTVASRLSHAFAVEEFDTEQELQFWSLAAEHVSRKDTPSFRDIVGWMDLLFKAPVHFIYITDRDNKLKLFRCQIISENLDRMVSLAGGNEDKTIRSQTVKEFEDQLSNLEPKISYNDDLQEVGTSSFTIGKCQHIPVFKDDEFRAVYCVGPYVQIPDVIVPRLSIVGRILSKWLSEYYEKEAETQRSVKRQIDSDLGNLTAGSLNIQGIVTLLLSYFVKASGSKAGFYLETGGGKANILGKVNVPEDLLAQLVSVASAGGSRAKVEQLLAKQQELLSNHQMDVVQCIDIGFDSTQNYIWLFKEKGSEDGFLSTEAEDKIKLMMADLLSYRNANQAFSNRLLETYYRMLRGLEQRKEKTYYHTPRLMAFCEKFASLFGLDDNEKMQLLLTAKLHDIGYVGILHATSKRSIGIELEHPLVGEMMVQALPVSDDVKRGIATHHEWIDGSGSPGGLKEEEIPWTGKIIAVFEFITQFVESHRNDRSVPGDKHLETLTEALLERTDKQFDIVLIPTVIELLTTLGWEGCCMLGDGS